MVADSDLVLVAHRSFIDCFRKSVEHIQAGSTLDRPGVFGFFSDLPISTLNGLIVTEIEAASALDGALDWIAERRAPYTVWLAEPLAESLGRACAERGLVRRSWTTPGMVLAPVPPAPPPSPGVTVAPVTDATYEEHLSTWAGIGMPDAVGHRLMSPAFLHDPQVRLFTGYLEGRPVGVSVALRTGATSGIVGVGTVRDARHRGVGAAVTWAAVGAGRLWDAGAVVLQSTEMGVALYRAMGFRTVIGYVEFGSERNGDA